MLDLWYLHIISQPTLDLLSLCYKPDPFVALIDVGVSLSSQNRLPYFVRNPHFDFCSENAKHRRLDARGVRCSHSCYAYLLE